MSASRFSHVKVSGMKTVVPERFIDIEEEIAFFGGSEKKLARQKKMIGYGRRYLADDKTTVTDLACSAAEELILEMGLDRGKIESLIFVNQKPDHPEPSDACIAHGRLNLSKNIPAIHLNHGCSGYVYALWNAHALIASGAVKNCLVLAGDVPTRKIPQTNRKQAPVFGDAASATFVEYTDDNVVSSFVLGTDGKGWDKIVYPFGGMRLPHDQSTIGASIADAEGNVWHFNQSIMRGEEVFSFTMDVAPKLISEVISAAGWSDDTVDIYAIHQANKQIVDTIVSRSGIDPKKVPVDTFTKYANNSTNSVVTVICDQPKESKFERAVLCSFGIGLSWAGAALDLSQMFNGGISFYRTPADSPSREEQIEYWEKYFKGEV